MSTLYIETSAILSWLFGEPEALRVIEAIDGHEAVVTSVLSNIETQRAFIRAESEKIINEGDRQRLYGIFIDQSMSWTFLEITSSIRRRAAQSFPVEPVRSLDAIHLSTALEFLQIYPDLEVLSFDKRITVNILPLGLIKL